LDGLKIKFAMTKIFNYRKKWTCHTDRMQRDRSSN